MPISRRRIRLQRRHAKKWRRAVAAFISGILGIIITNHPINGEVIIRTVINDSSFEFPVNVNGKWDTVKGIIIWPWYGSFNGHFSLLETYRLTPRS